MIIDIIALVIEGSTAQDINRLTEECMEFLRETIPDYKYQFDECRLVWLVDNIAKLEEKSGEFT